MMQRIINIRQGIKDLCGVDLSVDSVLMVPIASRELQKSLIDERKEIDEMSEKFLQSIEGRTRSACTWAFMGALSEMMVSDPDPDMPVQEQDEVYFATVLVVFMRMLATPPSTLAKLNEERNAAH